MEFDLLDGGEEDEHNDLIFVEISKISMMEEKFIFGAESFNRVLLAMCYVNGRKESCSIS